MQRLLLIDPVSPQPYRNTSLTQRPVDDIGTSVLRVARALAGRFQVVVAQRARRRWELGDDGVYYAPFAAGQPPLRGRVEKVVVVEDETVLPEVRRQFPGSELSLWLHTRPGEARRDLAPVAVACRARVIAASDYHRWWLRNFFLRQDRATGARLELSRVYSPIEAPVPPGSGRSFCRDKLLTLAGTREQLAEILPLFALLRRRIPELRLHVASTGAAIQSPVAADGVVPLGPLSRRQLRGELADSLCLFFPRGEVRHCSGLIYAEAHAAGTPVLTEPDAAAPEIVGWGEELCSPRDIDELERRLDRWRHGARPLVSARPQLSLAAVERAWLNLLAWTRPAALAADRPQVAV